MSNNLLKVIYETEKAKALILVFEDLMLDSKLVSAANDKATQLTNTFYALWDSIEEISSSLEGIQQDKS